MADSRYGRRASSAPLRGCSGSWCLTLSDFSGRSSYCRLAFSSLVLADWVIPWKLLSRVDAVEAIRRLAAVSRLGLTTAGLIILRAEVALGLGPTPDPICGGGSVGSAGSLSHTSLPLPSAAGSDTVPTASIAAPTRKRQARGERAA